MTKQEHLNKIEFIIRGLTGLSHKNYSDLEKIREANRKIKEEAESYKQKSTNANERICADSFISDLDYQNGYEYNYDNLFEVRTMSRLKEQKEKLSNYCSSYIREMIRIKGNNE